MRTWGRGEMGEGAVRRRDRGGVDEISCEKVVQGRGRWVGL